MKTAVKKKKRNPKAEMVGIDRWGKEYASYSLDLCKQNAQAEGVRCYFGVVFAH